MGSLARSDAALKARGPERIVLAQMDSNADSQTSVGAKAERSQALRLLKRRLESKRHVRGDNQSAACNQNDSQQQLFADESTGGEGAIPAAEDAGLDNQESEQRELSIAEQLGSSRDIVLLAKSKPIPDTNRPQSQSGNEPGSSEKGEQIGQELQIPAQRTKLAMKWSCRSCERECIPIREESRCLCGHRYKEHPPVASGIRAPARALQPKTHKPFVCTAAKCKCDRFFYVVAEGAWILRCRCKHKHTDHDPSAAPFTCTKPKCGCAGFDSPWICNCDHPWADHVQEATQRKVVSMLEHLQAQCAVQELNRVERGAS